MPPGHLNENGLHIRWFWPNISLFHKFQLSSFKTTFIFFVFFQICSNFKKRTFYPVPDILEDNIFYEAGTETPWKKYQLTGVNKGEELDLMLKDCTNLKLLAQELAFHIFKTTDDQNLDFCNYWISAYFNALMKENVIQRREIYRFATKNDNPQKTKDIEELEKYFSESMLNANNYQILPAEFANYMFEPNFLIPLNQKIRGQASGTIEELAELLVQHVNGNSPTIPNKFFGRIIASLLNYEREYYFTDSFLNGSSYFRSILWEYCKEKIVKQLKNIDLFAANAFHEIDKISTTPSSKPGASVEDAKRATEELINHIFYGKQMLTLFEQETGFLKNVFKLTGMNTFKFTVDFAMDKDNNHSVFRKTFLNAFVKEKLKNQILNFKQNVKKISKFADELKLLFNEAKRNNTTTIKYIKQKKSDTDGLIEALNGSIFINSSEKNKIKFCPNNQFVNPLAEDFLTFLHKKFNTLEYEELKTVDIEFYNYPPSFEDLIEIGDIDIEIEAFRKKLYFVISPDEKQLSKDISAEMGEIFNLIDSEMIYYALFHKILNWAKEKEDALLDENAALEFMNDVKTKISENLDAGCNIQYCEKLKDFNIIYDNVLQDVIEFLETLPKINDKRILHIKTEEVLLTAIKVNQTLESTLYIDKTKFIFNPLPLLLRMENFSGEHHSKHISKVFQSNKVDLLIIVDKKTKQDIKDFCETLRSIIQSQANKKIIVISSIQDSLEMKNTLISELSIQEVEKFVYVTKDETTFNDLNVISKTRITKNTIVNFQGNDIKFNHLILEEDAPDLIDAKTLQKIIIGEKLVIGESIDASTESDYYRQRKIRLIEINDKIFDFDEKNEREEVIAIEGINVRDFLKRKDVKNFNDFTETISPNVILNPHSADTEFRQLCDLFSIVHWLKLIDKKLIWFRSFTTAKSLKIWNRVKTTKNYVDESFFWEYIKQNRIVIIADLAGMGKSTILTSFAKTLNDTMAWKIRINLNQYTETLSEIKEFEKENPQFNLLPFGLQLNFNNFDLKAKDYGKLILTSCINNQKPINKDLDFESKIFNYYFSKRDMLIMFDGFDEINPNYGNQVLKLFTLLELKKENRLWITSRTNFKEKLQMLFNTFAYDLKPFDGEDQKLFLTQYWINNWKKKKGYEMPNQDRIVSYVEKLIKAATKSIGDIIGIPLQIKMLGDVFQEKDEGDLQSNWISCFEYVQLESLKSPNLELKLTNIFTLYEDFIKLKVFDYFLHEKGIADLRKPFAEKLKKIVYTSLHEVHKIFGFQGLYEKHESADLLTENEIELKNDWVEQVENVGIIDRFNSDGHPLFIHLTYAEYFAAVFLLDKICAASSNVENVFEIANDIFNKEVPVFVECFKHLLKQKRENKNLIAGLEGKTPLQYAAEKGLINCVNVFLSAEDFNDGFPHPIFGKTVLHYALKCKQFDINIFISLFTYSLIQRRHDYKYTAMFCLSEFLNQTSENILNSETANFFNDIKRTAENSLQPKEKTSTNERIKKQYQFILRKKVVTSNATNFLRSEMSQSIVEFLKQISFDSIKKVLRILNPTTVNKWIFDYIYHTCTRFNLTAEEKIKTFKVIYNGLIDAKEKAAFIEKMLILVVQNDCKDILQQLLSQEIFDISDEALWECYIMACKSDMEKISIMLLPRLRRQTQNSNISVESRIFYHAVKNNATLKMIQKIYDEINPSINEKQADGKSATMAALQNECNLKKIHFLLQKGADPLIIDNTGKSPLTYAVEKANDELLKLFKEYVSEKDYLYYCSDFDQIFVDKTRLHQAIADKNIYLCKYILVKNPDIKILDAEGKTPLYRACQNELVDIVKALLSCGACYNQDGLEEFKKQNAEIKEVLDFTESAFAEFRKSEFKIPREAFVRNATNNQGETLWHIAVKSGIRKNFDDLISNPNFIKQINVKNIDGNTALHLAVKENLDLEFIVKMLEFGAYFDVRNKNNEAPSCFAKDNVKDVFEIIAKVFQTKCVENLVIDEVLEKDRINVAKLKDNLGNTLLHYAVKENNTESVKILLSKGADINAKNSRNQTPLFYAAKYENFEMVKLLLQNDAVFDDSVNRLRHNNRILQKIKLCFDYVYNEEHEEVKAVLEDLEEENASIIVKVQNSENKTLIDYVENNYDMVLYLLEKGAKFPSHPITNLYTNIKNLRIQKLLFYLIEFKEYFSKDYNNKISIESINIYFNKYFSKQLQYLAYCDEKTINGVLKSFMGHKIDQMEELNTSRKSSL